MYITEDLPVNNTRRFFKNRPDLPHRSQPMKERRRRRRRRAPPPTKRGGTHGTVAGVWGRRGTSAIHLNTTNKSKTHHFLLNLVDFLFFGVFFFYTDFVKTKVQYIYRSTGLNFFSYIYVYFDLLWFTFTVCATTSHRRSGRRAERRRSCKSPVYKHCWCPQMLTDTRYKVRGHLLCRRQHLEDRMESISTQDSYSSWWKHFKLLHLWTGYFIWGKN